MATYNNSDKTDISVGPLFYQGLTIRIDIDFKLLFLPEKLHLSMNVCRSKDPFSFPRLPASKRVNLVEHNVNIIYNTRGINQHKKLIYILFQKRMRLTDFRQQSRLGRFLRLTDFLLSFLAWTDCEKPFDMIPHSNVANV